jgi:hypothetical protein
MLQKSRLARFRSKFAAGALSLAMAFWASPKLAPAQSPGPLDTVFTYQGGLKDDLDGPGGADAIPASGVYDFQFTIFDVDTGGSPSIVIGPISAADVTVTNGLFTVDIDFGVNLFDGQTYWLETAMKRDADAVFTTLGPSRIALTAAPNAHFAIDAGTVNGATAADLTIASFTYDSATNLLTITQGATTIDVTPALTSFDLEVTLGGGADVTGGTLDVQTSLLNSTGANPLQVSDAFNVTGAADFDSTLNVDGNVTVDTDTLFVDATTDRVGVNTATPERPFHVVAADFLAQRLEGNNAAGTWFSINNATAANFFHFIATGSGNGEGVNKLLIAPGNISGTLNGAAMGLDSSGNLGIGQVSPTQRLHVEGNARVTGAFFDSSNSAGSNDQVLTSQGTGTQTQWTTVTAIDDDVSAFAYDSASNLLTITEGGVDVDVAPALTTFGLEVTLQNGADVTGGTLDVQTSVENTAASAPLLALDPDGINLDVTAAAGVDGLRLLPGTTGPRVIGGFSGNTAAGNGATVGGGGQSGSVNTASGDFATVSGGRSNTASGVNAIVSGGQVNVASGFGAAVGGGQVNNARGQLAVISGGVGNSAPTSSVVGGNGNQLTISGGENNEIGGTVNNAVSHSVIGGGFANQIYDLRSTIAGGANNRAGTDDGVSNASLATVGGGDSNIASGVASTVPGGQSNTAAGDRSFAAGQNATASASADNTFVWSDGTTITENAAQAFRVEASGGVIVTNNGAAGLATATGSGEDAVFIDTTTGVLRRGASVAGLDDDVSAFAYDSASNLLTITEGGVDVDVAPALTTFGLEVTLQNGADVTGGTLDVQTSVENTAASAPLLALDPDGINLDVTAAAGVDGLRLLPGTTGPRVIGGFSGNTAAGDGATVSGGGASGLLNQASGNFSTVSGGSNNTASGFRSTVSGGQSNTANGSFATVGGGESNTASGSRATVGGFFNTASGLRATVAGGGGDIANGTIGVNEVSGRNVASGERSTVGGGGGDDTLDTAGNVASGVASTVPGGESNTAAGDHSFAAGQSAVADAAADNSFVWNDGGGLLTVSTPNTFTAQATNGIFFPSSVAAGAGNVVGITAGGQLVDLGAMGGDTDVSAFTYASATNTLTLTEDSFTSNQALTTFGAALDIQAGVSDSTGDFTISDTLNVTGAADFDSTVNVDGSLANAGGALQVADDLNVTGSVTAGTGVTATTGNIAATAGAVSAGTTVTAGTGVTATTGDIAASSGNVSASGTVTAGTGVTATTGDITASTGDLVATAGNVTATDGGFTGDVTADTLAAVTSISTDAGTLRVGDASGPTAGAVSFEGGTIATVDVDSILVIAGDLSDGTDSGTATEVLTSLGLGNGVDWQPVSGLGVTTVAAGDGLTGGGGPGAITINAVAASGSGTTAVNNANDFTFNVDVASGTGTTGSITGDAVVFDVNFAGNGAANTASRSDHDHDSRYYTETELNTDGAGGAVHWNNLTNLPAGFDDDIDNVDDADADPANEFNTAFAFDSGTNILTVTDLGMARTVDLSILDDDTDADADPANEFNTAFAFDSGTNILTVTDLGMARTVDLSILDDDTDADADPANEFQTLSFTSPDLSIGPSGNMVSLAALLDNTDSQTLSFASPNLSITGGNMVDLTALLDNTDDQTLAEVLAQGADANAVSITNVNDLDVRGVLMNATAAVAPVVLADPDGIALDANTAAVGVDGLRIAFDSGATSPNLIGGSSNNAVLAGSFGATISGGGESGNINAVTDDFGAIGGGLRNQAGNNDGDATNARHATVGGGINNAASGANSTIPGGENNIASGSHSFAAGFQASATGNNSFVWNDGGGVLTSPGANTFTAEATGGYFLTALPGDTTGGTLAVVGVDTATGQLVDLGAMGGDTDVSAFTYTSATNTLTLTEDSFTSNQALTTFGAAVTLSGGATLGNTLAMGANNITGTGDVAAATGTFSGAVTAASFSGSGAGLTGVDLSDTNELQNLYATVSGNAGTPTTANLQNDSLAIVGSGIVSTVASADTITITATEVDGSITNEIQDLSITNGSLSLSGDPTPAAIDLDTRYYTETELSTDTAALVHWNNLTAVPAGFADNTDDGLLTVARDATLTGNGTTGSPLGIDLAHANSWSMTQTFSAVDINGGAIDNTAIGAATRSTGAFTTLGATMAVDFDSTLNVDGAISTAGSNPVTFNDSVALVNGAGSFSLNQNTMFLGDAGDNNHRLFREGATDGARLTGLGGGTLGAGANGATDVLRWQGGQVTVTGALAASTTVTAGTGFTATTGNIAASSGNVTASGAVSGATVTASTTLNVNGALNDGSGTGANGQVLTIVGGDPAWAALPAEVGDITDVNAGTGLTATNPTGPAPTLSLDLGNANSWTGAQTFTSVDINGGTIDGTTINASAITNTPISGSTGSFTTIAGASSLTLAGADGTTPGTVVLNDATAGNTFTGALQTAAVLTANRTYTLPDASGTLALAGSAWNLTGNAGTVDGTNFIGTTDNVPFTVRVNNAQAFRLQPVSGAVNVIGGSNNSINNNATNSVISGGGANTIGDGSGNSFIASGNNNDIGVGSANSVIGGSANDIGSNSANSFIASGHTNVINDSAANSVILGGNNNVISAGHNGAFVFGATAGTTSNGANSFTVRADGGVFFPNLGLPAGSGAETRLALEGGRLVSTTGGGSTDRIISPDTNSRALIDNAGNFVAGDAAGGDANSVAGSTGFGTIGGGTANSIAGGFGTTIGGGNTNVVNGNAATVAGGFGNTAGALNATVGGGGDGDSNSVGNMATGVGSTVAGGEDNTAGSGSCATVGGGQSNTASAQFSTVAGGESNAARGDRSFIGGGVSNQAPSASVVSGNFGNNVIVVGGDNNIIGSLLSLDNDVRNSVISGGRDNRAFDTHGSIGGGQSNRTGTDNTTSDATHATVGGGSSNVASGQGATVGGGGSNTASGTVSTVPGGQSNTAAGDFSFAAGQNATITGTGTHTFAWSDGTAISVTTADTFHVEASGGVFVTDGGVGSQGLSAGTGTQVSISAAGELVRETSSARYKENIRDAALDYGKLFELAPKFYNYKGSNQQKVGFIAEEMDAAGLKPLVIYDNQGRPDAISYQLISVYQNEALKAHEERLAEQDVEIQVLTETLGQKDAEIERLRAENEAQEARLRDQEERLARLEALLLGDGAKR